MRYMGLDYGTKKIGVAFTDEAGTMGFPHTALPTSASVLDELTALGKERGVAALVVGESRDFSGGENAIAKQARAFGESLAVRLGVPVHFEPETLTTQEARRYPDGTRMPGSPDVDASAAALILTRFIERTS